MSKMPSIRIVKTTNARDGRDVTVYDLETGEAITNVHAVGIDITRENAMVRVTYAAPFVYEGPVTEETTDAG